MYPLFLPGSIARHRRTSKKSCDNRVRQNATNNIPVAKSSLMYKPQAANILPQAMKKDNTKRQRNVDIIPLNIPSTPRPTVYESGHAHPAPRQDSDGEEPPLLSHSEIMNTRLPPFDRYCEGILNRGSAQAGARCETCTRRRPVRSSPKRATGTQAPSNKLIQSPESFTPPPLKPIPRSIPTFTTLFPEIKQIPSPHNISPAKGTSTPKKHVTYSKEEKIIGLPSTSSLSSTTTNPSTNRRPRAPPKPDNSPCRTPRPGQKRCMSEQAAETLRIMEWAKERVRVAEKRVREDERAAYEEEAFVLRLRRWEAEMKVRRMMENNDEEIADEENHPRKACGMNWIEEPSQMERCRNFVWEKRERCRRGLAVALERC